MHTDYDGDEEAEISARDSAPSLLAFCLVIIACLAILGLGTAAVWLR